MAKLERIGTKLERVGKKRKILEFTILYRVRPDYLDLGEVLEKLRESGAAHVMDVSVLEITELEEAQWANEIDL